jgi:uncharacterized membrane protein (DUF485 family)
MKKGLYITLESLTLVMIFGGFIGFAVEMSQAQEFNSWATLALSLGILGILSLIIVRAIYSITKPEEIKTEGKRCPECQTLNDLDALYCKHCGKKL